jgi:ketosteroid isomerase-like protein
MESAALIVFRRFHQAWSNGHLDVALELLDPEVVARPLHGAMYTRAEYRGREGIATWYREMTGPWDRFEALVEEARTTPDGGVQAILRLVGYRGVQALDARVGVDCQLRAGRIVSLVGRNAGDLEKELRGA